MIEWIIMISWLNKWIDNIDECCDEFDWIDFVCLIEWMNVMIDCDKWLDKYICILIDKWLIDLIICLCIDLLIDELCLLIDEFL